ncbi:MAG: DUF4831 family protein [Proteiniphilum sp.]|jgi:hypothetical protein|nr:DUF4831 family protein [Proteiniphilum sp.]
MKRVKYVILLLFILAITGLHAQKTTRVNAIKANDYGVIYSLPKTSFEITLLVKKSTYQRGDFYPYAKGYLGVEDPITENSVRYTLEDITLINKGIVDKNSSFMVEFRARSYEPYLYLREDGAIVTVNAEPEPETSSEMMMPAGERSSVNPRRFLSQETLMAGSTAKQAELVARQIFDLRRSRTDILTGEAESMPPDGNAYKVVMDEIDMQERALTELFAGSIESEYFMKSYTIIPDENDMEKVVIARFSEKLGPVDAGNLAGEPLYLSLRNKTPKVELQLSERDRKRLGDKFRQGLVYNIPGKADVTLEYRNRELIGMEVDVVQYGSQDVLTKKMFENMKQPIKVLFYPELGAIKQIIQ